MFAKCYAVFDWTGPPIRILIQLAYLDVLIPTVYLFILNYIIVIIIIDYFDHFLFHFFIAMYKKAEIIFFLGPIWV
jgi:hypothetical protein